MNIKSVPEPLQLGAATAKKRKRVEDQEDLDSLRKRAQGYCQTWQDFKIIRGYKRNKLRQWLEEKDFEKDSELREVVFDTLHSCYARLLDMLARGGGLVREEIESDLSLRLALEEEGKRFISFMTNRYRILALSASDVYHGKVKGRKEADEHYQEEHEQMANLFEASEPEAPASPGDQGEGDDLSCCEKGLRQNTLASETADDSVEGDS